ncbi:MAG: hypothetical protein H6R01_458 [Burkholderiaceae bacterium]|nr:hypothetical protein [Burkholderiaceae bacterium]
MLIPNEQRTVILQAIVDNPSATVAQIKFIVQRKGHHRCSGNNVLAAMQAHGVTRTTHGEFVIPRELRDELEAISGCIKATPNTIDRIWTKPMPIDPTGIALARRAA